MALFGKTVAAARPTNTTSVVLTFSPLKVSAKLGAQFRWLVSCDGTTSDPLRLPAGSGTALQSAAVTVHTPTLGWAVAKWLNSSSVPLEVALQTSEGEEA